MRRQPVPLAIQTAETFFAERRERGNVKTAIRFLTRKGGEQPRAGDDTNGLKY